MAKRTQSEATWIVLDPETLPKASQAQYRTYKTTYAEMKADRETFENGLREALAPKTPAGKRIVFGYNFGKLSIAMVDDDAKKAAPKGSLNFADLLR